MKRDVQIVILSVAAMLLGCGKPVDPGTVGDSTMDASEPVECVPIAAVAKLPGVILITSDSDLPVPPRIGAIITVEPGQESPVNYYPAEISFDGEGRLKIRILIGRQGHVCGEVCQLAWHLVCRCP